MKKAFAITALILVFALTGAAFAADTLIGDLLSIGDLPYSPEFSDVLDCTDDILDEAADLMGEAGVTSLPESLPFYKAVKVYPCESPRSDKDLEAARSGSAYLWRMPVAREKGIIWATVAINDGKVAGYSVDAAEDFSPGRGTYIFDGGMVEQLLTTFGLEPEDACVYSSDALSSDFIVFRAKGVSYVIPFSSAPEKLGLENAEVYPLSALFNAADPDASSRITRSPVYYIVAGGVFAAALTLFLITRKKYCNIL